MTAESDGGRRLRADEGDRSMCSNHAFFVVGVKAQSFDRRSIVLAEGHGRALRLRRRRDGDEPVVYELQCGVDFRPEPEARLVRQTDALMRSIWVIVLCAERQSRRCVDQSSFTSARSQVGPAKCEVQPGTRHTADNCAIVLQLADESSSDEPTAWADDRVLGDDKLNAASVYLDRHMAKAQISSSCSAGCSGDVACLADQSHLHRNALD